MLANHRHQGTSIPSTKLPSGKVLYRYVDVLEAENRGRRDWRQSTVVDAITSFPKFDGKTIAELCRRMRTQIAGQ
jgi:hypothetical protein